MATAYINLGSNLGDRRSTIERAVAAIEKALSARARRSGWVETEAWGYASDNLFVNLGIAIETEKAPEELHRCLQDIQHEIDPSPHRNASGEYIDRAIDIDLIAVDDIVVDTLGLQLPHPRMHLRDFVTGPMRELAPDWRHPLLGKLW